MLIFSKIYFGNFVNFHLSNLQFDWVIRSIDKRNLYLFYIQLDIPTIHFGSDIWHLNVTVTCLFHVPVCITVSPSVTVVSIQFVLRQSILFLPISIFIFIQHRKDIASNHWTVKGYRMCGSYCLVVWIARIDSSRIQSYQKRLLASVVWKYLHRLC